MNLVVHVPHASTYIPDEVRRTFLLDDQALQVELLAITDHHVDEIVAPLADLGATIVRHPFSRLVCDPERFPLDEDELMAKHGLGPVYTHTSDGKRLRPENWSQDDREQIMRAYYYPHAEAMRRAVQEKLARYGTCRILDAHSYPKLPLLFEDKTKARPQLCLGHNEKTVPHDWLARWQQAAAARGLSVAINTPFSGAYVPLAYLHAPRVESLMVEFRRDLYLDEQTGGRIPAGIARLRALTVACCSPLARKR